MQQAHSARQEPSGDGRSQRCTIKTRWQGSGADEEHSRAGVAHVACVVHRRAARVPASGARARSGNRTGRRPGSVGGGSPESVRAHQMTRRPTAGMKGTSVDVSELWTLSPRSSPAAGGYQGGWRPAEVYVAASQLGTLPGGAAAASARQAARARAGLLRMRTCAHGLAHLDELPHKVAGAHARRLLHCLAVARLAQVCAGRHAR